jgi:hypothetical protein
MFYDIGSSGKCAKPELASLLWVHAICRILCFARWFASSMHDPLYSISCTSLALLSWTRGRASARRSGPRSNLMPGCTQRQPVLPPAMLRTRGLSWNEFHEAKLRMNLKLYAAGGCWSGQFSGQPATKSANRHAMLCSSRLPHITEHPPCALARKGKVMFSIGAPST